MKKARPDHIIFGSKEHLEWGQVALFEQTKLLEKAHIKIVNSSDSKSIALGISLMSMFETSRSILLLCRNNVRDSYALSRTLLDTTLNMALYSIDNNLVDKALRHAQQKSFRDIFRRIDLNDYAIKSDLKNIEGIVIPNKLKEAYHEFTSNKGKELRNWSDESKTNVFKKIQIVKKEIGEDIGNVLNFCLFSIYRHASEIIHGTLFGTFYGFGFELVNGIGVKNSEEYQNYIFQMNSHLMSVLNLLLESTLKIVNSCYPIIEIIEHSRSLNNELNEMTKLSSSIS